MGQVRTISSQAHGLSGPEATAFASAARALGPKLALAYGRARARARSAFPRWGQPWPVQACVGWPQAWGLATAALTDLCPWHGLKASALLLAGRVRRGPRAVCVARPGRAPLAFVPFDRSPASASLLAHELAHAAQMSAGIGGSRPAPPTAPAEAHAHAAELMAQRRLARVAPAAGAMLTLDCIAAMLVRHPARAAFAGGETWEAVAFHFAPGLDWREPPARTAPSEALFAYAAGAAAGFLCAARIAAGCGRFARAYMEWAASGPAGTLGDLAGLLGARSDDPGFYAGAYEVGLTWMRAAEEDL